jgi:hypothetical protein
MSVASLKAMWQLIITPSFWEKTAHGLGPEAKSDDDVFERERHAA